MAETKWTPAPWKASKGAPDEPNRWLILADDAERPYLLATIENGQPGDCLETEGHTAALVAAAPDLYAVVADLIDFLEERGCACDFDHSPCVLCSAREALAKARGEA